MNITDILFNAAGGGVVGSLLHLGSSFFDIFKKKQEAKIEIDLMNAKVAAAEKEAAWNAFTASQKNEIEIPTNPDSPKWVNSLGTVVAAFRSFTRPALTWCLLFFVGIVFFNVTPEIRAEMVNEIQFAAFTALFWWFGSRYSKR